MSQVKIAETKKKNNPFWPVMGLVLAVALGVISWFIAPSVRDFVFTRFPNSVSAFATTSEANVQLIFTGVVFFILMCISGMIVAVAVPKKSSQVKDKDIRKQQASIRKEREVKKRKRLAMEKQMHEYNRKKEQ